MSHRPRALSALAAAVVGLVALVVPGSPAQAAPPAPTIRDVVTGGNSIAVLWNPDATTSPQSYRVYRGGVLQATVPVPPSGGRTTNTARYIDTAVVAGQTYSYTVSMVATDGSVSAQSAARSATHPAATTAVPTVNVANDAYKSALDLGAALIKVWYPKFADRLTRGTGGYTPPGTITLTHLPNTGVVAYASGSSIVFDEAQLNAFNATTDPLARANFMANYLHEMTHVIQGYALGDDWLAEGVAVWATHEIYHDAEIDTTPALDQSQYYTLGYEVTARFLKWVATIGPWTSGTLTRANLVRDANVAAHNGTFDVSSFFTARTGKTAAQLWGQMAGFSGVADQKFKAFGNTAMCLENGHPYANNADTYLGNCWNTRYQIVASFPVSPSPAVQLVAAGKCLDVYGGSLNPADGTHVVVYTCVAGAAQQYWKVLTDGTIRHNASGKCIQPVGGTYGPYNALEVRICNGGNAQKWVKQAL